MRTWVPACVRACSRVASTRHGFRRPVLTRMRVCVWQGVAAMVRTFPSILGLNPEKNIEPKLAWLMENIDLDEELVLGLVKVSPGLLICAIL